MAATCLDAMWNKSPRAPGRQPSSRIEQRLDPLVAEGLTLVDMSINSIYPDIQTADIVASRDFYVDLLGLQVAWEAHSYIALVAPEAPGAQLALVAAGHDSVPPRHHRQPAGVLISFEVSDATAAYERAAQLGVTIALDLCEEEFGQRHFMAIDPDGLLVDVIEILFVPEEH